MTEFHPPIPLPPDLYNEQGEIRRVGIELEFTGLELDQITSLVQSVLGGEIKKYNRYEAQVLDTRIGTVRVEFDALLFREMKVHNFFKDLELEMIGESEIDNLEQVIASIASLLVPYELVFPPIPIDKLGEIEELRVALSTRAQGTTSSVINAFGLHLNVELPSVDVETILRYLRAFLILYDELKTVHEIDAARSLTGFISPFSKQYTLLVLNEKYKPDQDRFIDDYLLANPTRNRPLDLLPILAMLDEGKVRRACPDIKIAKRPAFHYRMPNSMVDESDWSFVREWTAWMKIERLASDPEKLAKRSRYESRRRQGPLFYWLRRLWRTKPLLTRKPMIAVTGPDAGGFPAWACTWLAIRRAGGIPVHLTPSMFRDDPSLPPFDGLILGGGADVDPGRYGQGLEDYLVEEVAATEPTLARRLFTRFFAPFLFVWRRLFSLTASGIDTERDQFEQSCLEKALREQLPVLGICRGAQFLNIHFGGTLLGDLSNFYGEVGHISTVLPRKRIHLEQNSLLRVLVGRPVLSVNSLHKLAVGDLGEGVRVTAWDDAGVIQAIEFGGGEFLVGVQWHPEYLPASRAQQGLFRGLVQEARSRKS